MDAASDAEQAADSYVDIANNPGWRFEVLKRMAPHALDILDLASGYGTAVFHGCQIGLQVFGVEPNPEKISIGREMLADLGLPQAWHARIVRAVGETLPFQDDSFDVVTSYQTLEHVKDLKNVLAECIRITRAGGGIHIHCPDYSGSFEGHYRLPWLPFLPHGWAKLYLRLLRRPVSGWEGITPITRGKLTAVLKKLKEDNPPLAFEVHSMRRVLFIRRFRERFPSLSGTLLEKTGYIAYRFIRFIRTFLREEKPLHVWIVLRRKGKI